MSINRIKYLPYLLCNKKVNNMPTSFRCLHIDLNDVAWFCLSTSSILRIELDNKRYYFRECARISNKYLYIQKCIEDFCFLIKNVHFSNFGITDEPSISTDYDSGEIDNFIKYISEKKKSREYLKMLLKTEQLFSKNNYSIWNGTKFDTDLFCKLGISDVNPTIENVFSLFLWYIRGKIHSFPFEHVSTMGAYSCFFSGKTLASRIVAEELHQGELIVPCTYCKLSLNGHDMWGVLSEEAPGQRMRGAQIVHYEDIQCQLLNLNIIDYISMQKDHGPNNYNYYYCKEGSSISAFDNDNAFAFFPTTNTRIGFSGASPIIDRHGYYNRPYIDRNMMEALASINKDVLKKRLKEHLNSIQVIMLDKRIEIIKNAINKSIQGGLTICLDEEEWGMESLSCEKTFSKKNSTYLSIAIMDSRK